MISSKLVLGVPSKGRLMEQTEEAFAKLGLAYEKIGHQRGYRGIVPSQPDIDVAYMSASEIARHLCIVGRVRIGSNTESAELIRPSQQVLQLSSDFSGKS